MKKIGVCVGACLLCGSANAQSIGLVKEACSGLKGREVIGDARYSREISMTFEGQHNQCIQQDPQRNQPVRGLMSLGYMNSSIGWLCGSKAVSVFSSLPNNIAARVLPNTGYIFTEDRKNTYKYEVAGGSREVKCEQKGNLYTLSILDTNIYKINGTDKDFKLHSKQHTTVTTSLIAF